MRILQINLVYKYKSTGRTCYQLDKYFREMGHESMTAFGWGKKQKDAYRIDTYFEYYFHNILSRITGLEGRFSYFATKRLINFIKKYNPDLIILHSLHGHYINQKLLFKYLKKANIKLVYHLHDCWPFTGKCTHYTKVSCSKWKTQCYSCPCKKEYPISWFFDFSKKLYIEKKSLYSKLPMLIIGNSHWTSEQASMSFLKNNIIKTVYNWIDIDDFCYSLDNSLYSKYNIPTNKFLIICVTSYWEETNPRFQDLIALSNMLDNSMHVVMLGKTNTNIEYSNITHIDFVSDTKEIAKLYSICDCFVHLSTEDSFGKVIAEAQACGTPAIVYDSTACSEIVKNGETGFICEPRNLSKVYDCLKKVQAAGKTAFKDKCRNWIIDEFSFSKNCSKFLSELERYNRE